ncbi:hypothetical protein CAPTEDRAFT_194031 [Capitella teleta]|uniref:Coiled-coil domain-containing protein 86 n=1 Tax=Capitella teleta TaxID=283909 RepID=R7UV97_CAPTE|nr:hypothetical protein CAPTEDRAFT_194031 [Capitella teleta]|eukprot:ELU10563.1 hypothetical protein CAPTEDRAFT_194031 [Capitella teleta]
MTESGNTATVPRGKPKSGRLWKTQRMTRHTEMIRDKPLKSSWKNKVDNKNTKKNVKLFEKELQEARAKRLEAKRVRSELNAKRREENQKKAEVVQVVKNAAKLKRLKKKQLRNIQKR